MAAKGVETIIEIIGAAAGASGASNPLAPQNPDDAFDRWKKDNWKRHKSSSSSTSSSSGEGLRRRNVSSAVDRMKKIINDDLDDPTESPIKDLAPNDIAFPVGSSDYFTNFTGYEPVFYPNRRGRFRKWLLLGSLGALPAGATAGLVGALTQDYDGEDVVDDQSSFDDCKPDQYAKIKPELPDIPSYYQQGNGISKCNYRKLFAMLMQWATLKQHPGLAARKSYNVYLLEELFQDKTVVDLIVKYHTLAGFAPDKKDTSNIFKTMIKSPEWTEAFMARYRQADTKFIDFLILE